MIVYRDVVRETSASAELLRLRRLAAGGSALPLLVTAGELEQAVLDSVHTITDDVDALTDALGAVSLAAARVHLGAAPEVNARLVTALADRLANVLPRRLRVRAPEGYLHYALDPSDYAAAARRYVRASGEERARRSIVVGVRSIGTSLSAVVAAVCGAPRVTLRARGPTGGRTVRATERVVRRVRGALAGGDALVVDEGPGLTGETFHAVARWLGELGFDADRIVLFPSSDAAIGLASPGVSAWYRSARRFPPEPDEPLADRIARRFGLDRCRDLGGGRWRSIVPGAMAEPAFTALERPKYVGTDADGRLRHVRYGGVGRWLDETAARALRLDSAGLVADLVASDDGFLALRWWNGRPVSRADRPDRPLVLAVRDYLVRRARAGFGTGAPTDVETAVAMLEANVPELTGHSPPALAGAVRRLERLPEREAVVPDARLQPREWIRAPDGIVKVDALDHGDGVRLPGPTDLAWDLAGAAVEFHLPPAAVADLVDAVARAARDDPRTLATAVAAYRPVYAACAFADVALAARVAARRTARDDASDRVTPPRTRRVGPDPNVRALNREAWFYDTSLRSALSARTSLA